ncbi:MAG: hypothetical protein RBR68_15050 [Tenuifilaceae bacterium]|nr:hypothetical protein [Tenuifilaceae bacterium]
MATTAQNVYDYTMSLIDERLESGVVDPTSTAVFAKNAPYLITMLQDEVMRLQISDYYKTYEITKAAVTETDGGYKSYDMPSDFFQAYQIVSIEDDGNYELGNDMKWEAGNKLLLPDAFIGTVKVVYYPIATPITALTDTLVLDDNTCRTVLVYGLASRLLTNENRALANYFGQLYDEMKNRPLKQSVAFTEDIQDNYDSTLTF